MNLHQPVTASPVKDRINRLVEVMAARGWDGVIASLPENVLYLSGALIQTQTLMRRRQCAVVVKRDGVATLVVAEIERALALRLTGLPIETYAELTETACSKAAELLARASPAVVAIEEDYLPVADHDVLVNALGNTRFVGADGALMALRAIKSSDEIAAIGRAASAIDTATLAAVRETGAGATEAELAMLIGEKIQRLGVGTARSVLGFAASGENLRIPHHHAGRRRLRNGDAVKVGGRATFEGYYGQLARMAIVGEGNSEFLERYARASEAHKQLIASMRSGVSAGEVYAQAAATRNALGLPQRLSHVGHGMGLEYMEHPKLAPGVADALTIGMTMQATTVCDDPDAGLIQIVDMVAIEAGGARLLSTAIDTRAPLCFAHSSEPL